MTLWGAKVHSNKPYVLQNDEEEFIGTGIYNAALVQSSTTTPVHLYLGIGDEKFLLGTFRPNSVDQIPLTIEVSPEDPSPYEFSIDGKDCEVHLTGANIEPELPPDYEMGSDDDEMIGLNDSDNEDAVMPAVEDVTETKPTKGKTPAKNSKESPAKTPEKSSGEEVEGKSSEEKKPAGQKKKQGGQQPGEAKAADGSNNKGKKRPAEGTPPSSGKKQKVEGGAQGSWTCAQCPGKSFKSEEGKKQHMQTKHAQ